MGVLGAGARARCVAVVRTAASAPLSRLGKAGVLGRWSGVPNRALSVKELQKEAGVCPVCAGDAESGAGTAGGKAGTEHCKVRVTGSPDLGSGPVNEGGKASWAGIGVPTGL